MPTEIKSPLPSPEWVSYHLAPAVLAVCTTLLSEGRKILYQENAWIAIKVPASLRVDDVFQMCFLQTSWLLDAKKYDQQIESFGPMDEYSETHLPALGVTFSKEDRSIDRVQLVPLLEIEPVVRVLWTISKIREYHLQIDLGDRLPRGTTAQTLLVHKIFPWLLQWANRVCVGGCDLIGKPDNMLQYLPDRTATLDWIQTISPSLPTYSVPVNMHQIRHQCHLASLEAAIEEINILKANIHKRYEVIPAFLKLFYLVEGWTSESGDDTMIPFLRVLPVVWKFLHLPSEHFALPDHEDDSELACRRMQLQVAVWVKVHLSQTHQLKWIPAQHRHLVSKLEVLALLNLARLHHGFRHERSAFLSFCSAVQLAVRMRQKTSAADGNVSMISESKAEILTALRQGCGTEVAENPGHLPTIDYLEDPETLMEAVTAWMEYSRFKEGMVTPEELWEALVE